MRAIVVSEPGGLEALTAVEVVQPPPGPGQRTGATPLEPPFAAGVEGAGVVGQLLSPIAKGIAQVDAALLVVAR